MNKNIIAAAALALVSGAAMADATLYGILDLSVTTTSNAGANKQTLNGMTDGVYQPSLWGITGSEDLGNGLKANFNLQSNMHSNTGQSGDPAGSGATKLFDRFATVGVSGDFGSINAGEMIDPLFLQSYLNSVRVAHAASLAVVSQLTYGGTPGGRANSTVVDVMQSNWLTYKTPVFNNFSAQGGYEFGNTAGNNTANSGQYIQANYDANGLSLSAGYEVLNNNAQNDKLKKALFGANYTTGNWKFAGNVNTFKSDASTQVTDANGYEVGVEYKFTSNFKGDISHVWVNDNANHATPKLSAISLLYSFSKRTNVWLLVDRADSDNLNAKSGAVTNGGVLWEPLYAQGVGSGSSQTGVALGITHTF